MTRAHRPVELVALREIKERVRGRTFLLSTLAIVALFVAGAVLPGLTDQTKHLRVGITGRASPGLAAALRKSSPAGKTKLEIRRYRSVADGEIALMRGRAGVLIVDGEQLVWKAEPDAELAAVVSRALQQLRLAERAGSLGLSGAQTTRLFAPLSFPARRLEATDPDRDARRVAALIVVVLLLTVIVWYGTAVAEGVAQEKSGRVMEVLLSRVRPRDLLAGKVLGIGLVGLAQLLLGLAAAAAALVAFDTLDVPAAVPPTLAAGVVWFALGYAFWSVAYAALGALVSRVEDLQPSVAPLNWILILSFWAAFLGSESADAWYTRVASFVPITAPFVMPVRIAVAHVAAWETALSGLVTVIATYALVRVAAAVYAGALMRTGGRPRPRDLWRAARA